MTAEAKMKKESSLVGVVLRALIQGAFYLPSMTTVRVAIKFIAQPPLLKQL